MPRLRTLPDALRPHLRLLSTPRAELTARYDARFTGYIASYGHPETFLLHQAESFSDAEMAGATVLDFGCGFGLLGAAFAALGAKRVIGVDLDGSMIRRGRALIDEWLPAVKDKVTLVQGSLFEAELPVERFDVITAIESLSHVQNVTDALGAFRARIAPRGRVLVSDGNNRFYLPGKRRREKIWDRYESKTARPARRKLLQDALPNLSEAQLERLSDATIGLTAEEAVAAARKDVEQGVPPVPAPSRRLMHPVTGYHEERELDPFELIRRFEEFGFTGHLLPPHSNYPPEPWHPKRLLKTGLRMAYPLTVPAFPGFRLKLTFLGS